MSRFLSLFACIVIACVAYAEEPVHSALWGESGERWSPESRLPDFSFAGYRHGETAIPTPEVSRSVADFGATPDDETDDSDAFLAALAATESGVVFIPEGRYIITKFITISKPNVVLRGAGPDKTTLYFPIPMNDIKPNWGATTGGRPTSNYSWSGGFLRIQGDFQSEHLTEVSAPVDRGSKSFTVADASALSVGQEIIVRQDDTEENSLANHLYSGDPRIGLEKLNGRVRTSFVARINAIDGNTIRINRPLRSAIELRWNPTIHRFEPTVTESGIEGIRFEYPNTPYKGHFTELGFNAVNLSGVSHCWARNLHVHNSDSGVFVSGYFNTVDGIIFTSERARDSNRNATGHHGLTGSGGDHVFNAFDFRTKFVHDLTVSRCAGNVFSNGRGDDLSMDHHRFAPYENLFTNLDMGTGEETWRSGGGAALGAHCAARGTFWNIRASKSIAPPPDNWGPWSINLVGVGMAVPDATPEDGRWYEHNGKEVAPRNLYHAQVERRLSAGAAE